MAASSLDPYIWDDGSARRHSKSFIPSALLPQLFPHVIFEDPGLAGAQKPLLPMANMFTMPLIPFYFPKCRGTSNETIIYVLHPSGTIFHLSPVTVFISPIFENAGGETGFFIRPPPRECLEPPFITLQKPTKKFTRPTENRTAWNLPWNLAYKEFLNGNFEQSESYAVEIYCQDPYNLNILILLASINLNMERLDQAEYFFQLAKSEKPDDAKIHYDLANVYLLKGMPIEAVNSYEIAVYLKPDFIAAQRAYGMTLVTLGQMERAKDAYNKALRFNPDEYTVWNDLGCIYRFERKFDEATVCFKESVDLNPTFAAAWNNLGAIYVDEGEFEKANRNFKAAISIEPDYAEMHANLAKVYLKAKLLEEAEDCFSTAISLNPKKPVFHAELSCVHQLKGSWILAFESFGNAVHLEGNVVDAHYQRGTVYEQAGWLNTAEFNYKSALFLDPNHQEARSKLNNLLSKKEAACL